MSTHHTDWRSPPGYEDTPHTHRNEVNADSPSLAKPKVLPKEPRYVFYRVYDPDGPIPTRRGYEGSPLISRIKATSVPPPHTVASLKRALILAEQLPDPSGELTALFQTKDARSAMDAALRVGILTGNIGATPSEAVALVFHSTLSKPAVHPLSDTYLYYRLYIPGGEDKSARSFDKREPSLGRIARESICPPRTVLSVKRRIAKVEGKPIYALPDSELFTDMTAENAQPSEAIVGDDTGTNENDPISLVQPERRAGLYNRPLHVLALPPDMEYGRYLQGDPRWLSDLLPGDILHTDGITRRTEHYITLGYYMHAYMAVDQTGRKGLVWAGMFASSRIRITEYPNLPWK
ncbi:hypothetical protein B0H11DRAFT_687123 [Mycena galericulata]|nr:hypothetical protein B0H11DRAFT_687123 [Mycena galericulata]